MQFSNHRSRAARGSIVYLAVDAIAPSAVQPRQNFSPAQLEELSRSIAEYGVLSPLTVRPRQGGYELVAGERRLRAARMAGLSEVPCIIMELDLEEASFIALVENLQRNDLDFLEEARGIDAGMRRQETDEALILTINIPKARRREPAPKQAEPVPVG